MSIGDKLKEYRIKAKLTQAKVEELTGITNTTLSNWETGAARPTADNVGTLCRLYNANPNDIYEWDDEPQGYYLNPESAVKAQELKDKYNVLLDATRDISPEDLDTLIRLAKAMAKEDEKDF